MKDEHQELEWSYKVGFVTVVAYSALHRSHPNPFRVLPESQTEIQNYGKPCTSIQNVGSIFTYIKLSIWFADSNVQIREI